VTQAETLEHTTDGATPAAHDDALTPAGAAAISVIQVVTDADGDTDEATSANPLSITFEDDGPAVTVNDTSGSFTAVQPGDWSGSDSSGADGFKSLNINLDSYTIDANSTVPVNADLGTATTPDQFGNFVFTGSITDDFTDDGVVNDQTVEFKLTFHPDGTPTYDVELTTPPGSITTFSSADGQLAAGGPDSVQTLLGVGPDDIVFSSVNAITDPNDIVDFLDASETAIEDPNTGADYLSPLEMNVSTSGIGNGNNNFNGNALAGVDGATTKGGAIDESFVVDPHFGVNGMTVFIDNSVGGYDLATEEIWYRTYFTDGTFDSALTKVTASDLTSEPGGQLSFVVGDLAGTENNIDAVQLFMGTGTVKIPVIEFNVATEFTPQPLEMDLTATLVDKDNDSSTDSFSIDLIA
jgi:hypothetical protein